MKYKWYKELSYTGTYLCLCIYIGPEISEKSSQSIFLACFYLSIFPVSSPSPHISFWHPWNAARRGSNLESVHHGIGLEISGMLVLVLVNAVLGSEAPRFSVATSFGSFSQLANAATSVVPDSWQPTRLAHKMSESWLQGLQTYEAFSLWHM